MQLAIIGLGLLLLVIAFFTYSRTKKLLKVGITTMAEIIDVVEKQSQDYDEDGYSSTTTNYYPVLKFQTKDGQDVQFQASVGVSSKNKYKVGQKLEVVYDPSKPEKAKIKSFIQLWLITIILTVIGAVFVVAGILTA